MANKHFFQPLLPGFHSHLTIPVAFFLKNIQGRYEHKTAELRSDASKITWKVKIDGRRLTDGWKDFALSHDLRLGDIVVFRHENNMSFHVTALVPSCCEIQYESCLDEESNSENIQEESKKRSREAESSLLDSSCFVANVSPSSLRYDLLHLPRRFVKANGIVTGSGNIVLMNEKGKRSWTLKLRQKPSCGTVYIRRGWRSFCYANGLIAGSFFTFKLIRKGRTLVLHLSRREPEEEEECSETNEGESLSTERESDGESSQEERISQECSRRKGKKDRFWKPSSSSSQNRFVTLTITPYNINRSVLRLPIPFTRMNGINVKTKMTMLDKHGVKWPVNLLAEDDKRIRVGGSWKDFLKANCVKTNDSIRLELILDEDSSYVLKFCSKVKL